MKDDIEITIKHIIKNIKSYQRNREVVISHVNSLISDYLNQYFLFNRKILQYKVSRINSKGYKHLNVEIDYFYLDNLVCKKQTVNINERIGIASKKDLCQNMSKSFINVVSSKNNDSIKIII
jgi:hypothetical protein